jgi:hypothetical protein
LHLQVAHFARLKLALFLLFSSTPQRRRCYLEHIRRRRSSPVIMHIAKGNALTLDGSDVRGMLPCAAEVHTDMPNAALQSVAAIPVKSAVKITAAKM